MQSSGISPTLEQGCAAGDEAREEAEETLEQMLHRVEREAYREASITYGKSLTRFAFYVLNHHDPRMAMWIIAYVLELQPARGRTCEEIGRMCGLKTRQAVDKEVQRFCSATGYTPATPMKKREASLTYSQSRIESILENQET